MAINLERVLNERKYGAGNEKNSKTLVFRVGNENVNSGRDSIRKNPYIGKESNGGSASTVSNAQGGNVPSVKRTEPSTEIKNAVEKAFERINGSGGKSFGGQPVNLLSTLETLSAAAFRLRETVIENKDFLKAL